MAFDPLSRFHVAEPHVFVGISSARAAENEVFITSHRVAQRARSQYGLRVTFDMENIGGLELARNMQITKFRRSTATHFLCVDDDVANWKAEDLVRFIASEEHFIGGILPERSIHPASVQAALARGASFATYEDIHRNLGRVLMKPFPGKPIERRTGSFGGNPIDLELLEVAGTSAGFMCLSRAMIDAMVTPFMWEETPMDALWHLFSRFEKPNGAIGVKGEDYDLCDRWRERGGRVYVDTQTNLCHIGKVLFMAPPIEAILADASATKAAAPLPTQTRKTARRA